MSSILAANCEQNYYFILVPAGLVLDGVRCDCFLRRYGKSKETEKSSCR